VIHLPLAEPIYELSSFREPALTVQAEDVVVESDDAFSGQISRPGDRRDKWLVPYGSPVSGPIALVGGAPGEPL